MSTADPPLHSLTCPAQGSTSAPARQELMTSGQADHNAEDDAVLRMIVEGTARSVGEHFFPCLVRHLATAMDVQHAFVAEFTAPPTQVRTVAYWSRGGIVDNVEWDVRGTPCADVIRGQFCHHASDVWRKFPNDQPMVEMKIESYLGVPLQDASGQVLGHLAVFDERAMSPEPRRLHIFRIFAARAAAELERSRMEQRLRASEEQFRNLFEEAPIAYVYEDTQTRFISANRAAQKLLGLKPEEVVGTVGMTLVAPTQEAQDAVHDAFADIRQGKERGRIEFELRRKDNGQPVWVQFYSKPDPDGQRTRTMIIDITQRVLAERERNRLRQQNLYLQEEIRSEYNFEEIIGSSPAMRSAFRQVEQVAGTDSTVLITGETGTGKELIARAIHSRSRRKDRPLIKLNCAALPTGLVESELFGHEKGAFTGAVEKRIGRFTLAHGGTIFLDEIGEVPLDVQVKLLRVLQEQEFEPVGSTRTHKVDVRVIAATNRDLARAVAEGAFRADLFYRLNVFPIALPPLRLREGDLPLLVHYFVNKYAMKIGRSITAVAGDAMEQLSQYDWPGNIRELENVIERAVILCAGSELSIDPQMVKPMRTPATSTAGESKQREQVMSASGTTIADRERQQILDTLARTNWVIDGEKGAGKILGLHPNTLRSRMKKLGIKRGDRS